MTDYKQAGNIAISIAANYYTKRIAQAVFTFWATITATFFFIKWMPGGPMDFILQQMLGGSGIGQEQTTINQLDPSQMDRFRDMAQTFVGFDPTLPLHIQYLNYVSGLLQGDFGQSVWYQQGVWEILGPAIPWTVFISTIGLFISFVTRVVIGALLAYKEGSRLDFYGTTGLIWSNAVPFFIVALILLYLLSYNLGIFPAGGRMNYNVDVALSYPFIAGVLHHAALPVIATAWVNLGAGALGMRANSIQVLGEDYMRVARLRGLRMRRLATRYVARNAILPMYTGLLIGIGYVFGGSVILETIFQYRGVGFFMFKGIQSRDYPLLMAGFILLTASVVLALLIADLTYGLIDPRIQEGSEHESF